MAYGAELLAPVDSPDQLTLPSGEGPTLRTAGRRSNHAGRAEERHGEESPGKSGRGVYLINQDSIF